MLKPLRLPLENGKYAYIEVKAVFKEFMEIHIVDRTNVKSGVSIIDCIEELQEKIISEFGAKDFVMDFLQNSNWYLYSKHGRVADYRTIQGVRELQPFDPVLNQDLVKLAMERSGIVAPTIPSIPTKRRISPKQNNLETPMSAAFIAMDLSCEQLTLF